MGNSSNSYATSRPLEGSVVDLISGMNNKIISTSSLNTEKIGRARKERQKRKDLRANLETVAPITDILVTMKRLLTLWRSGGLRDQIAETTIATERE
jgi:hypothetical protein